MNRKRFITLTTVTLSAVICVALWTADRSRAAFSSNFDELRTELVARSQAFSNSINKVEQKQKKACDKAIAALDKATTFDGDIKAGGKVAKTLQKAFTNDFPVISMFAAPLSLTSTNNLQQILINAFNGFASTIQGQITDAQTQANGLANAAAKATALAQLAAAQAALDAAVSGINAGNFATGVQNMGSALKNLTAAQNTIASAGGGGGGGGGGSNDFMIATILIGGTNQNWAADVFDGPNWTQSSSTLDLGTIRTSPFTLLTPAACGSFNGATGDYPLGGCGGWGDFTTFYATTTGTLHIATFVVTGTNATSTGTFSFSASDGATTIVVTNGSYSLSHVLVAP